MKYIRVLLFLLLPFAAVSQELFPCTEPASTMPKGIAGLRYLNENFKEEPSRRTKYWHAIRLMYGITGKFQVMLTGSVSNHHTKKIPADLSNYFMNHHQVNYIPNPALFEGLNLYFRYRWLSIDKNRRHTRVAFFGEAGKSFMAHTEAEAALNGDVSGAGGGVIATQLINKFAVSFTASFVYPLVFKDPKQEITFRSGNTYSYNVSLGYRIWPAAYSSYKNLNINLYCEFLNRKYDAAVMTQKGDPYDFEVYKWFDKNIYYSLQENFYSEIRPSLQFIINSNNRIDLGFASPVYSKSYIHFYPMIFLSLQKYFY
jgi:hypothetical protein